MTWHAFYVCFLILLLFIQIDTELMFDFDVREKRINEDNGKCLFLDYNIVVKEYLKFEIWTDIQWVSEWMFIASFHCCKIIEFLAQYV